MTQFIETLVGIFQSSGFAKFGEPGGWLYAVMICVGCFLLYLAIVKEFEPLILLPMAFGMILANLPGSGVIQDLHDFRKIIAAYRIIISAQNRVAFIVGNQIGEALFVCLVFSHHDFPIPDMHCLNDLVVTGHAFFLTHNTPTFPDPWSWAYMGQP